MKKIFFKMVLVFLMISCISACVQSTPQWDKQFGDAARKTAALQVLNPDAGTKPVSESMDGQAGREAIGRYRNSFKEHQNNANSFVIGVGR
jgi:hypothetical protein